MLDVEEPGDSPMADPQADLDDPKKEDQHARYQL
jgi:hypothetical protein